MTFGTGTAYPASLRDTAEAPRSCDLPPSALYLLALLAGLFGRPGTGVL
jgi:hypothetical protein